MNLSKHMLYDPAELILVTQGWHYGLNIKDRLTAREMFSIALAEKDACSKLPTDILDSLLMQSMGLMSEELGEFSIGAIPLSKVRGNFQYLGEEYLLKFYLNPGKDLSETITDQEANKIIFNEAYGWYLSIDKPHILKDRIYHIYVSKKISENGSSYSVYDQHLKDRWDKQNSLRPNLVKLRDKNKVGSEINPVRFMLEFLKAIKEPEN